MDKAIKGISKVKPMMPSKYSGFPFWKAVYAQPDVGGQRCLINKQGLFNHLEKPIKEYKYIHDALKPVFEEDPDLILDGELVKVDESMRYYVYDSPSKANYKFSTRLVYLSQVLQSLEPDSPIWKVDTLAFEGNPSDVEKYNQFHELCIQSGFLGSTLHLDVPYESGKSRSFLKR